MFYRLVRLVFLASTEKADNRHQNRSRLFGIIAFFLNIVLSVPRGLERTRTMHDTTWSIDLPKFLVRLSMYSNHLSDGIEIDITYIYLFIYIIIYDKLSFLYCSTCILLNRVLRLA